MRPRAFDWEAIHRRLAAAAVAIAEGPSRRPEEIHRILEARARAAASAPAEPDDAPRLEILAFSLAGELHGVETRYVREVCRLRDLTPLPCTPPFLAGVMSLRGRILAIVDLRKRFELPSRGLTDLDRVVVLRSDDDELGLLTDSVVGVRSVAASDLQAGLPTLTGIRERFLEGITAQMLVVLDGRRLLAGAGLAAGEKAAR